MTDKIYTIDEIRSNISPIAKKYGVERVYLFGSYARGEATKAVILISVLTKDSSEGWLHSAV